MAYPAQNTAAVSSLSAAASPAGSSSPVRSGTKSAARTAYWIQQASAHAQEQARHRCGVHMKLEPDHFDGLHQGEVLERQLDAEFSDIGRSDRFVAGWWILPVFIGGALVCIGLAYALGRML